MLVARGVVIEGVIVWDVVSLFVTAVAVVGIDVIFVVTGVDGRAFTVYCFIIVSDPRSFHAFNVIL